MPPHDFILNIGEERLPILRKQLSQMESGVIHVKSCTGVGGSFVDETQEWIFEFKKTISIYENIVDKHRNED